MTLLRVGTAVRERRRVSIEYRSWRGATSARELDPYGVVFHSGRWYLTGHDHHRGEIRTFRLDRIASVSLTDAGFAVPDGFDPVAYVSRSLAAVPYAYQVEVLLETDLAQARQRIRTTMGELTETADGVLLRARVERLDGMAQLLASLGWPFTIVAPAELRQAVAEHAARLAGYAGRRVSDT